MTIWEERDLPVLHFLAGRSVQQELFTTHRYAEEPHSELPELSERDVYRAVTTLVDADFLTYGEREPEGGGDVMWIDLRVTGLGKQVLGEWPLFAALGDPAQLAELLERLAERASTDEEEGNFRAGAKGIRQVAGTVLRELVVGAGIAASRGQIG